MKDGLLPIPGENSGLRLAHCQIVQPAEPRHTCESRFSGWNPQNGVAITGATEAVVGKWEVDRPAQAAIRPGHISAVNAQVAVSHQHPHEAGESHAHVHTFDGNVDFGGRTQTKH